MLVLVDKTKRLVYFLVSLPKRIVMMAIRTYQLTISPDHGVLRVFFRYGYCRFFPTCSEYSYQAIKKNGVIIGCFKTLWRILRCNPWSKGGVDVP